MKFSFADRRLALLVNMVIMLLAASAIVVFSTSARSRLMDDLDTRAAAVVGRVSRTMSPEIWDLYGQTTQKAFSTAVAEAILDAELDPAFINGILIFGDYGRLVIGRTVMSGDYQTLLRNSDISEDLRQFRSVRTPVMRDLLEVGYVEVYYSSLQAESDIRKANIRLSLFVVSFAVLNIIAFSMVHRAEVTRLKLDKTRSKLVEAEKLAALAGLVAGIAHEINTPLGIALTAVTHARDESERSPTLRTDSQFRDTLIETLNLSESSLKRVSNLVNGFKEISADSIVDEKRSINLATYIRSSLEALSAKLRRNQVEVDISGPEDIHIITFPGAIFQIITNLVNNSLLHGFASRDSGAISVRLEQNEAEGQVFLIYRDDGVGMSESIRKRIFEPFFTTRRGSGGIGLGMNIVYNIIRSKLKGDIEVLSIEGHGTEIRIMFPGHQTDRPEEEKP